MQEILKQFGGYVHYFQDVDANHNSPSKVQEEHVKDGDIDSTAENSKNRSDYNEVCEVQQDYLCEDTSNRLEKSRIEQKKECSSVCSECGKAFPGKQLQRHIYKMHSNLHKKYFCDICNLSFYFPSDLRRHQINHEDPKFKCEHCLKRFKTKFNLNRHIKFCH